MNSTSDDDDEEEDISEQNTKVPRNSHLRKCLLCNIEVESRIRKEIDHDLNFSSSNHSAVIIVIFVIDVYSNMTIM